MYAMRIRVFGTPGVSIDCGAWLPQKTRASELLLGYLVLNGRRSHHREKLAAMLWRDADPEKSRNAFRTTLWRLRKLLEPGDTQRGTVLRVKSNGNVGLNWESGIWCDVCAFREAFRPRPSADGHGGQDLERMREAIGLYRGDLMESFHEDWILIEREALRAAYLTGLAALMQAAELADDPAKALDYGRAILIEDPLRETIHRRMIALFLQCGDRTQALRQYDICAQAIRTDLGIEPMEETRALRHQILTGTALPRTGRDRFTEDLTLAIRQVQDALCGLETARTRIASRTLGKAVPTDQAV